MPSRHVALRRSLVALALLLVVALVATVVTTAVLVRRPLPTTSGELSVAGLSAPVTVHRDAQGVPDIYASTAADLFMAQGYVQAQDRFFEMDYRRHVTAGRLSELVGENADALEADKVIRTFGWREVAEQEWEILDSDTKNYLQAYADGVNAYLAERSTSQIAVEYSVLGLQVSVEDPERWDPVDSLAWLKAMAWDLRGNYDDELARAQSLATVRDVGRVDELFPDYPDTVNAPILSAEAAAANSAPAPSGAGAGASSDPLDLTSPAVAGAVDSAAQAVSAVPVLVGRGAGIGSNSWVVSGEHTATGSPMLANDPHLGLAAPSIWAQVGLHCDAVGDACPFDVTGFSFAGFPGVIIGHNPGLAWGITNLGADVTDFFVERTQDDTYQVDGTWNEMTTRTEVIKVAGADDVTLEVRSTGHGPIISDVLDVAPVTGTPTEVVDGVLRAGGGGYEVALGWTALTPGRTADAIFAMNTAADAEDIAAAARLFEVPSQNIVFATTDGHIGYQAPGTIPVRGVVEGPMPSDGTWPRPGWDSAYDWQGTVDPATMPSVLDPAEGFIVAANQAVAPAGAGPYLTSDWDYGFRSQRIRTLLEEQIAAGTPFTVDDMERIQGDTDNPFARLLVPVLLEQRLTTGFERGGQDLLRDWDYSQDADSPAAAYFSAVWAEMLALTFDDELSEEAAADGSDRWLEVVRTRLDDPMSSWWDDRRTADVVETRDSILQQALVNARSELTVRLGSDPSDWRWGSLHTLDLEHPVLGGESVPGIVRGFVNPPTLEMSGGASIVDATSWDASTGSFEVTAGPSMRAVVDLADLDASTWVVVTGTSGHPASSHYEDQLSTWAAGDSYTWRSSREAVEAESKDELTLTP
ncbi:penicillin acylase family protein [Sanguibacter sp. 4.1]|uniref:Penicillin acylase family protein n=1 Tax=Sanguibacter biliveldensis TaxID=3030830 RepID=A0AAF0Z481_9MICO|nr:penicillin acylase family protein [Sanguibacter sp. 4.1]WPF81684.1 penicillin acylase family protein [Sanguibacter sp. 4.1]